MIYKHLPIYTHKEAETMNEQITNTTTVETEQPSTCIADNTEQKPKYCPKCNAALLEGQRFCQNCGACTEEVWKPKTFTCSNCGIEVEPQTKFCPNCGNQATPPTQSIVVQTKPRINKKKIFLLGSIAAAVLIIATIIILCIALREIPVESISVSESKIELKEGETKNVSCTVYPSDASDKTVTWSSSDKSIATVTSYGMITAVKKGSCIITASCGEFSTAIHVTVKSKIDFRSIYNQYCLSSWASVGSDNSYLSIDSNPYDYDDYSISAAFTAVEKINKALGLPDSLWEEMLQTTWSMGKQSETYQNIGITVSWTYHPDKGLELTYKFINE